MDSETEGRGKLRKSPREPGQKGDTQVAPGGVSSPVKFYPRPERKRLSPHGALSHQKTSLSQVFTQFLVTKVA